MGTNQTAVYFQLKAAQGTTKEYWKDKKLFLKIYFFLHKC